MEGLICQPDLTHREICGLPGAWVREIIRKLPSLVQPTLPSTGFSGRHQKCPNKKAVENQDRPSGPWDNSSGKTGAQVVFSSALQVTGMFGQGTGKS